MPDSDTHYFIIACHGWSASNWLAYSLNLHPDIACGHSSAAILAVNPSTFDNDGLSQHISQIRQGYKQRQSRPIIDVYAELKHQKPVSFIGTVHTYRLRDLPIQQERFPLPKQRFRTVNLVRHPLDLVVSGYGQFKDLFRIDINDFSWTLRKIVKEGMDIVENICHRHDIVPGDFNTICFFGACVVMGSLRLDLDALQIIQTAPNDPWCYEGIVRMEDVTSSPEVLAELIDRITGQNSLATAGYLEKVYQQDRINIHNREASTGVYQRWSELEDWQRDAFVLFLRRFNLQTAYEGLGYDFDFMKNWSV